MAARYCSAMVILQGVCEFLVCLLVTFMPCKLHILFDHVKKYRLASSFVLVCCLYCVCDYILLRLLLQIVHYADSRVF